MTDNSGRATGCTAESDWGNALVVGLGDRVRRLGRAEVEAEYAEAFTEWAVSEDSDVWEAVVGDGMR